jgi:hypothetical protein
MPQLSITQKRYMVGLQLRRDQRLGGGIAGQRRAFDARTAKGVTGKG